MTLSAECAAPDVALQAAVVGLVAGGDQAEKARETGGNSARCLTTAKGDSPTSGQWDDFLSPHLRTRGEGRTVTLDPARQLSLIAAMTDVSSKPPGHPAIPPRRIGVLLVNLGTPDATDYWSMRRY